MRAVMMHGPRDVRVEDRPDPVLLEGTDAIIRVTAACVCGSDLWPYRGTDPIANRPPMGHEYVGVVEQIGDEVSNIKVGDFVVGSFFASDNTCEICRAGYQSRCVHAEPMGSIGTQAELRPHPAGRRHPGRHSRPSRRRPDPVACWPPPTCSAPAGSPPSPPRPAPARRSPSSVTAPSACSAFWPPSNSAPSGSSPSAATPTGRPSPGEFGATDIVEERGDEGVAADQGTHRRARRAQRHRSRRHPGIDDAGHPRPPAPAGTSATSASPTTCNCRVRNCSSPACTCTAVPRPSAASCPS